MNQGITVFIDTSITRLQRSIADALGQYIENSTVSEDAATADFIIQSNKQDLLLYDKNKRAIKSFRYPIRLGDLISFIRHLHKTEHINQQNKPLVRGAFQLIQSDMVILKKDERIKLTDKEYDILRYLFKSADRKVTRDEMLEKIWGYQAALETHTLETHLYRLRKKIEDDPSNPTVLITDDEGYYLNLD